MKKRNFQALFAAVLMLFLPALALLSIEGNEPVPAVPDYAHLSVGAGYGLNYGGIGLGFEFNPRLPEKYGLGFHKYLSVGLGFGYLPDGGIAYSFGFHVYPMGRDALLQPRLSVQYGVVAVVRTYYSGDEKRAEGVAFGAGLVARLASQLFIDADAHLIVPVDYSLDELKGGSVRFSAGLRYRL